MKKDTKTQAAGLLRLFVYGTLKRGYWNHERYCADAVDVQPATVIGKLYEFSSGIPILKVPESSILTKGTSDILSDVNAQARADAQMVEYSPSQQSNSTLPIFGLVRGEIISFDKPQVYLPPIDRLEGYNPQGCSWYERVLVPVFLGDKVAKPAWMYVMGREMYDVRPVEGGEWVG